MAVGRRGAPLTWETVEQLPAPCRSCLFWERGDPRPDDRDPASDGETALVRKQAWVSARLQDGHAPGRVIRHEGELAAWALFAPTSAFARRRAPAPRGSHDALQVATLWVQPHWRGQGLGRLLLQAAIREALRTDLTAVEAYADRRWRERGCLLPATWLLREGFDVHRESPRTPLLRLDVERTVRWAPSLEAALDEWLDRLPLPVRRPEGVTRTATGEGARAQTGSGTATVSPTRKAATASVSASATRRW